MIGPPGNGGLVGPGRHSDGESAAGVTVWWLPRRVGCVWAFPERYSGYCDARVELIELEVS